ncbi:type 1 fimbrial protein [Pseudomonas sp. REP124]|uniref:fimbrial protein n=1 Tax=Pseudomonas sp. REP124 TaxID=2875731 RepID=UPI001CCDC6DA|nr:fimbrial protein [Pseudomonas sp. REP124]MBZ9783821.1 type 1 fimbrial protein [Pseudomonas sp. REP124]
MKKSLIALTLGLAASLAGTSAFANSVGQVNFTGNINANTCPVYPIDPGTGAPGPINLGSVAAVDFGGTVGTEVGGREFALLIKDGAACNFAVGDTATVQFDSTHGNAGTDGKYYGIQTGGALGVALAIKDNDDKHIDSGTQSKAYPLNPVGETRMMFNTKYRSVAATVAPGPVIANVNFIVALP